MKVFLYTCALLLAFCGGILCTSCRTANAPNRAAGTDLTGPYVPVVVRPDSSADKLIKVDEQVDKPARRLFGLLPPKDSRSATKVQEHYKSAGGAGAPRKCKGCTIVYSGGPATVTTTTVGKKATAATAEGATATSIGKAKGPTAIGDSAAATDNTKAGQRGGAAATAAGATATATTEKSGIPWWLWVGGAVVLAYVGYRKFSTL